MTVREIPRSFVYACDSCGQEHVQDNAGGHYTGSRPVGWVGYVVRTDDHPNHNDQRLLCETCGATFLRLIEMPLRPTHLHHKGYLVREIGRGRRESDLTPNVYYEHDGQLWDRPVEDYDEEVLPDVRRFQPIL